MADVLVVLAMFVHLQDEAVEVSVMGGLFYCVQQGF